jgi:hypothetical protein
MITISDQTEPTMTTELNDLTTPKQVGCCFLSGTQLYKLDLPGLTLYLTPTEMVALLLNASTAFDRHAWERNT